MDWGSWPVGTHRNDRGELVFGGTSAVQLALQYGTPLYVFDELTLRGRARRIRGAFASAYSNSRVVYAGKAYISPSLVSVLVEEGIGLDVVSGGEIFAGMAGGMDPADMVFHGNNKSRVELEEAVSAGVGLIAIDNEHEIALLEAVAASRQRTVPVVLRLNPGIDPRTHQKMRTGATDSKFGFPVWDGQAARAAARLCATGALQLEGYHAHVGSQIFDPGLVSQTIGVMMAFSEDIRKRHGLEPKVIIPGGGFGMADDASGNDVDIEAWAAAAANALQNSCITLDLPLPQLVVEPGRAIIGPAGVALYEVGARKEVPGVRTYVSVDGGMADNIRPSLYGARYGASLANRFGGDCPSEQITVAGKYCESGDVLIEEIALPVLGPGDLLAVPMAGAYCLAMSSNYNLSPRPAAVLVTEGETKLIRRRETYADMLRAEVLPDLGERSRRRQRLPVGKDSL